MGGSLSGELRCEQEEEDRSSGTAAAVAAALPATASQKTLSAGKLHSGCAAASLDTHSPGIEWHMRRGFGF